MTLLLISLITACAAGIIIISYEFFARPQGWPVGELFQNDVFRFLLGGLSVVGAVWFAISNSSFLWGIGVFILGWVIAFLISFLFRSFAQWIAVVLLVASWIFQFFL